MALEFPSIADVYQSAVYRVAKSNWITAKRIKFKESVLTNLVEQSTDQDLTILNSLLVLEK